MSSIVQYLPETLSVTMRILDGPEKKRILVRKPGVVQAKGLLLRLENGREIYLLHAYNHYVAHNNVHRGYCDYPRDSFEVLRHLFVEGHESSLGHLLQRFTPEEVAKIGTVAAPAAAPAPAPAVVVAVAAEATAPATSTLSVPSLPPLTFQEKLLRLPTQIPVRLRVGAAAERFGMLRIQRDSSQQPLLEVDYTPVRVFFNNYLATCEAADANIAFWVTFPIMLTYFFVDHPVKASLGHLLETGDGETLSQVGIVPVPVVASVAPVNEVIMPAAPAAAAAVPATVPAATVKDTKLVLDEHFRNTEKANVKRLHHRAPIKLQVDLEYDSSYATDTMMEIDGTFSLVSLGKKIHSGLSSLEVLHYLTYGTKRLALQAKVLSDPFYGLNRLYYQDVRKSLAFYIRRKIMKPAVATVATASGVPDAALDIRERISLERKKSRKLHAELASYAELEKQIAYNKNLEARLAALKASLG
jgi:hypothetical protein